jgi:formamidopyrimidine-DNA glycosylase
MPELPEVESLRRSLVPYVIGKKIESIQVKKPKLVSGNGTKRKESQEKVDEFVTELSGEVFKNADRRAKNLIFEFESGKILLVHLKMTGQLVYKDDDHFTFGGHPIEDSEKQLPHKHSHVIFKLNEGTLYYNDTRMFGYLLYCPSRAALDAESHFEGLGIEPEDPGFTLEFFKEKMKKKSATLKTLLLNQQVVVGLGNIYCDEVCFEAGILPDRKVDTLTDEELKNLYHTITRIIPTAIEMGGSSVANYLLADGSRGNYAREHKVYLKGGRDCEICGNELQKMKIASRTTVFCTTCQK